MLCNLLYNVLCYMLYLAIETTGIAGYLLAGYVRTDDRSAEAGLKYFLFGAATSAVMLYGFSLLYGFTGETNLGSIATVLVSGNVAISAIWGIVVLILVIFMKRRDAGFIGCVSRIGFSGIPEIQKIH